MQTIRLRFLQLALLAAASSHAPAAVADNEVKNKSDYWYKGPVPTKY